MVLESLGQFMSHRSCTGATVSHSVSWISSGTVSVQWSDLQPPGRCGGTQGLQKDSAVHLNWPQLGEGGSGSGVTTCLWTSADVPSFQMSGDLLFVT